MKNKKNKAIIDTYETLYGIDIVVANRQVSLEKLRKLFVYSDGVELDNFIIDGLATTCIVKRLSDNKTCILIKDNKDTDVKSVDKKLDFINTIAHESLHAVLDIYDIIQQKVCTCTPEPMCYLIGYIAECAYKTLTKK
jgi:hypothetical protein